ncbi:MAG: hypothetical protein AAFX99_13310, partial [Myxococcota bacterium]
RGSGRARWAAVAAFVLPSLVSAGLFLGVNTAQNGDPFKPGYMRKAEYERENGYRFANWRQDRIHEALNTRQGLRAPGFVFDKPLLGVANTGLAVLRLNFALFGWPISLMLVLVAGWRGRRAWLFWGSLGSFSVTHLFGHDTGIDAFGPTHYFECLLPLVVLSTLGLRNAVVVAHKTREVEPHLGFRPELLPVTVVVALIGLNIFSYTPLRVEALGRIATDTHMPFKSAQTAGLRRAVVFAYRPFTTFCNSTPAEHFVFWRPNNDPDLTNDILWVNHINVQEDTMLMTHFPDRQGFVMLQHPNCSVQFFPLAKLKPGQIPDNIVGGFDPAKGPPPNMASPPHPAGTP